MYVKKTSGPRTVRLCDGRVLSLADLPSADTRWVASRKEVVVRAIIHGLIPRGEALQRYGLSDEELDSWHEAVLREGRTALKVRAHHRRKQPEVVDFRPEAD